MLLLGDYNTLRIVKRVDFGLYLDGGPAGEILLPKRYAPQAANVGEELQVFIYLDQDERIIATTEQPKARVGEFAYLECKWVNQHGAFLDWGLMKDLFCPFREQKQRMERGKRYLVYVYIDEESYRIVASAKVEHFLSKELPPYQTGDEVDLLVWQKTELGWKVIVNGQHQALVYRNQVFRPLHAGDRSKGYITAVRGDGKIDVALQRGAHDHATDFADTLLRYLYDHNGRCPLGDKSDAEDIKETFQVSKRVFKQAVGDLFRRRLITLSDRAISLNSTEKLSEE